MKSLKLYEEFNNIIELRNCDANNIKVKNIMNQYSKLNNKIKSILINYNLKIILFGGQLTDNKELSSYKNNIPRGYPSNLTWEFVDAMHDSNNNKIFIGIEGDYYATNKEKYPEYYKENRDVFMHELGHVLDDAIGKYLYKHSISKLKDITKIIKEEPFADKPEQKLKGYYNHPREYIANAFDYYFKDRNYLVKNNTKILNLLNDIIGNI